MLGIEDQADPVRKFAKAYEMGYRILIGKAMSFPVTAAVDRNDKLIIVRIEWISPSEMMASAEAVLD